MTIKALTGLVPEWYTPEDQAEETNPAEFLLKPLTGPQIAKLQTQFNADTGQITAIGLLEAAQLGVTGWRNVTDHQGADLKFTRRGIDDLPYMHLIAIGGEVLARSLMSDEDEKNL